MHPAFWPYLTGLVPIFLTRHWPARFVAILFGLVSVGLGIYYVRSIQNGAEVSTAVQQTGQAVTGALSIAVVSAMVDVSRGQKIQPKRLTA